MANRNYTVGINNNMQRQVQIQCPVLGEVDKSGQYNLPYSHARIEYISNIKDNIVKMVECPVTDSYNNYTHNGVIYINDISSDVTVSSVSLKVNNNSDILGTLENNDVYGSNPQIKLFNRKTDEIRTNVSGIYYKSGDTIDLEVDNIQYSGVIQYIDNIDLTGGTLDIEKPAALLRPDGVAISASGGDYGTYSYYDNDNVENSGTIDGYELLSDVLTECQLNNYTLELNLKCSNYINLPFLSSNCLVMGKNYKKKYTGNEEVTVYMSTQYSIQSYQSEYDEQYLGGETQEVNISKVAYPNGLSIYCVGKQVNPNVTVTKDDQTISREVYCRLDITLV